MKRSFECLRDGLRIRGTEYRTQEGKLPVLILCHGYLANQRTCRAYAELAASLGYAAFTFDFNGGGLHSKSSGKSTDMTVFTEVADLKAVIRYVQAREDVNGDDISLLGCSQGGVVCAMTAKSANLPVKRLILLYPALCIPDDARAGHMMFARFDPQNIPPIIQRFPMKVGGEYARCVRELQLSDLAGGYSGPVLLLHGTADKIVNIRYAREASKLYANIRYHEIAGGEHGFRGEHEQKAQTYIRAFLEER